MVRGLVVFWIAIFGFALYGLDARCAAPPATTNDPAIKLLLPKVFTTTLHLSPTNNLWVGTEDAGVWLITPEQADTAVAATTRPSTPAPRAFTTKDGLGDNHIYAIATDRQGRVWLGHLNHGVSVYNGKSWQNYDGLDGPIGERVFDLAVSPVDGDVWMATSAGISRYRQQTDTWCHYTRAEGLPEDQINSLAFDRAGTIYAGTQCYGLAKARALKEADGTYAYPKWNLVAAPDQFGPEGISPVPLDASGTGLPSNQINQILVGRDQTVWVATNTGLAWSRDAGETWRYIRGRNYVDKVKGLYGGPPKDWRAAERTTLDNLLPEDYLTCLAEDGTGAIWLGTRQSGFVAIHPVTNQRLRGEGKTLGLKDNYISALLITPDGRVAVGSYQNGLALVDLPQAALPLAQRPTTQPTTRPMISAHPKPAAAPTLAELNRYLSEQNRVRHSVENVGKYPVTSLVDDWRTQGDWLGRYGRYWANLCAFESPYSFVYGVGGGVAQLVEMLGPHSGGNNSVRYWVHWLYSADCRVLEIPAEYLNPRLQAGNTKPPALRRQSEVDDNGEAYPLTQNGPHLYFTLYVPPGEYMLSMYFFNKDGHTGSNRMRDYLVEIKAGQFTPAQYGDTPSREEEARFNAQPCLAKTRVRDFWGGVHKRFAVRGGQWYSIRVNRNYSLNAICSSVMLDHLEEQPPPYYWDNSEWSQWMQEQLAYRARDGFPGWREEDMAQRAEKRKPLTTLARRHLADPALRQLRFAPQTDPNVAAAKVMANARWQYLLDMDTYGRQQHRNFQALARYYRTQPEALVQQASCAYETHQYEVWEKLYTLLGQPTARQLEHNKIKQSGVNR